jgi:hypothetical protein
MTIEVRISHTNSLPAGLSPVVMLGPNGSGKMRHAAQMAGWHHWMTY